ncbi:DUF1800 domain-containing protein [Granulicella sp. S156]|uniref:DUF1800 domain-containing protein n=1 Tax=Granulicella sp. S156 TaxID=1747224 RepID=UPI00131CBA0F|nr:DUF1800 domain-containing protein [Granulicella sp. S156]
MTTPAKLLGHGLEAGRAATVAALCVLMVVPPAMAAVPATTPSSSIVLPTNVQQTPLTHQQKTLHALNRLTFGPRPGDEQAVNKMGLEPWFQRQLHPETIDDSAFEARLNQFPALRLSQAEMMRRYPAPQMIRQMARTGAPLPTDPVEHAIYADSMAAYLAKIENAEATQDSTTAPGASTDMAEVDNIRGAKTADADSQLMSDGTMQKVNANGKRRFNESPMGEDEVAAVLSLPPGQRFERLVAMSPEEMVSFRKGVKPRELGTLMKGLSPAQQESLAAMQGPVRMVSSEAMQERILRDAYSERQLQAVMVDFWLNHFSVYIRKNQLEPYLLASYEHDAVLPNALGKFEDLLIANAKSPAMLLYLDNAQSIGPNSRAASRGKRISQAAPDSNIAKALPKGLNENYGRELMELHTLGVNGGYTQKDVIEVAKCFTGWTIDRPNQGGSSDFVFEENRHEPGPKTVLGHTIPEGGVNEGLQVLHILATSPATAHFVSNKLAVRFVSDTPPPALVNRMAATFLKTDGDIRAVLSTMFHSPEFWAPSVYRAKVKTPIEFMASALRASDATVANPIALVQAMNQLGMPIYGMQTPNGYSWQADHWVSSNALVSRMNFALVLSGDHVPGAHPDWPRLLGDPQESPVVTSPNSATELKLEALLLGQPAASHTRETVMNQFTNPATQQAAQQNFALKSNESDDVGAGASFLRVNTGAPKQQKQSPGFQAVQPVTPLDTMAGLLLGSPDFQRR